MVYSEEAEWAVAQDHIFVEVGDVFPGRGPLLMLLIIFHELQLSRLLLFGHYDKESDKMNSSR